MINTANGQIIVSLGKGNRAGQAVLVPAGFQYAPASAIFGTPSGYFAPDTPENRAVATEAMEYSVSGLSAEERKARAKKARLEASIAKRQALLATL